MDKITKALAKFSLQEKKKINTILNNIKQGRLDTLDVKKLKGYNDVFRVRKGKLRIIFIKKEENISILTIEKRSDNTYNI